MQAQPAHTMLRSLPLCPLLALLAAATVTYEHPAILGNVCVISFPFCLLLSFRGLRWLAAGFLAMIGVWMGLVLGAWRVERTCAPVIAALERHHDRVGRYPEHLGQLVPDFLPGIPEGIHDATSLDGVFEITYYGRGPTEVTGSAYSLTGWLSQGMFRCSYRSTRRVWEIWD